MFDRFGTKAGQYLNEFCANSVQCLMDFIPYLRMRRPNSQLLHLLLPQNEFLWVTKSFCSVFRIRFHARNIYCPSPKREDELKCSEEASSVAESMFLLLSNGSLLAHAMLCDSSVSLQIKFRTTDTGCCWVGELIQPPSE